MKYIAIIMCMLGMAGCSGRQVPDSHLADSAVVASVAPTTHTIDENIGMMLLVGFRGTEVDSTKNPEIISALRDYHVGSVILFDYDVPTGTRGRNIKSADQVRKLCSQLRAISPDLLIGADQEGGYVSRFSPRYGFARVPSAKRMGTMGVDSVRHYADITGLMLADVGVNLDFAPVADVDVNPSCPVIGAIERSFSESETAVSECCQAWVEAIASHGVVSCMKHFPGHGSAHGDTHQGLVDVSNGWQRRELEPYRHVDNRTTMVMTAHVVNRRLDPSRLPASLSPTVTTLLRDTLGFDGVIVTDDLAMGAIVDHYSFERAVRMAVLAGADLLCLSNNGSRYDVKMVPRAFAVIRQMIDEGAVDEERIAHSADRIRRLIATTKKQQ